MTTTPFPRLIVAKVRDTILRRDDYLLAFSPPVVETEEYQKYEDLEPHLGVFRVYRTRAEAERAAVERNEAMAVQARHPRGMIA